MTTALAEKLCMEEEYLTIERAAEHKSEYFNGRMYAMVGASRQHFRITTNTTSELQRAFKGQPCEVFSSEMRVRVSDAGLYTYPDVVAVCGEQRYLDDKFDTLLNPTVIVEVLSTSTEAFDRGDKFDHYRSLESVQEVLFVAQHRVLVEHFVRRGDEWVLLSY